MPQEKLLQYLEGIANDLKPNETPGESGCGSGLARRRRVRIARYPMLFIAHGGTGSNLS